MRGQIGLPQAELVRASAVSVDVGVQYLSGGGASLQPVKLRSLVEPAWFSSAAFPGTVFANGNVKEGLSRDDEFYGAFYELEDSADPVAEGPSAAIARTQPATLDAAGAARLMVGGVPAGDALQALRLELDYQDANGATQTVSRRAMLWPGQRIPGIAIADWNARDTLRYTLAVIDPAGRAVAGARVESDIFSVQSYSHRKRLIGGFYAYETTREVKRVAAGCSGETDARGQLACAIKPPVRGSLIVRVKTTDAAGRSVHAHREMWVAGSDDACSSPAATPTAWTCCPNSRNMNRGRWPNCRCAAVPRAPRRWSRWSAKACSTVSSCRSPGRTPTVRLPIKSTYAPNVVVSVLAVRGPGWAKRRPPR